MLFAFRLALKLGKTIKELVETISYHEFMLWACYYGIEPWGGHVDGVRLASINSAIYNAGLMTSNPKRLRSKPFKPEQFFIGIPSKASISKKQIPWQEKRKAYDKLFGEAKG